MVITISPTSKMVEVNGVPARIWEGETTDGIKCHVFVTRVAVAETYPEHVHKQFREALQETKQPSAEVEAYPLRLIL